MATNTPETLLQELYTKTLQALIGRVNSEDVTAADLQAARQFLKDNGIESIPEASPELGNLGEKLSGLPFEPKLTGTDR